MMIIHQFFVPGIAHSSYMVAGNNICAVIDPERNIRPYLDSAKKMGLKITHILETHLHWSEPLRVDKKLSNADSW
ncbi:MAG TPA: hypothetical protein PLY74_13795, partial [Methanothrix soehngenii]|nr:hypothetical protein [Methanothrix soehngenii]HPL22039.1 hypothetical protein [Methanothrix soehngenii]